MSNFFNFKSERCSRFNDFLFVVQRSSSGRQRKIWSPHNDPFKKGRNADFSLLGGLIETEADQGGEDEMKRKDSAASSSTASTNSKSLFLHDIDNVVLYRIIVFMMEYLSNAKVINAEKCPAEDIRKLRTTLMTCLTALTSAKDEEDLSFQPGELRYLTERRITCYLSSIT